MADYTIDTNESARADANAVALSMANSAAIAAVPAPSVVGKLRLCEGLIPDVNTVKADLTGAETTLGGYPAGGYTIDDMAAALDASGGGAVITTPLIDIRYTIAPAAVLSAWWIEDGAGKVRKVGVFDPPRSLAAVGQGFEFLRQFGYGRNT